MPALPWIITGVFAAAFLADGVLWSAAAIVAPPGHAVPGYGSIPMALRRGGIAALIGDGSRAWFAVVALAMTAILAALATAATVLIVRHRRPAGGHRQMVSGRAFADLQKPAMAKRAQGLRPSIADTPAKRLAAREIGVALGDVSGTTLYKSFEDVELVICGPRSNKTSAKVVPDVASATGTVVLTSNKPDVWLLTSGMRAKVGRLWLFDPQRITYQEQGFWWDLLACIHDVESAARVAAYFMREVGGGGSDQRADPFFTPASAKTLRQLLLAAACSGHTLRDVALWVATRSEEPAVYLERAGYRAQAESLRGTVELPSETKGGIYEGVSTALACLDSESLLRWVTPPSTWDDPPEDPDAFPRLDLWSLITKPGDAHPTVYLLSREGEGSGRPVVAAIVGELINVAVQAASARGGRLDPVITLQLDEAANIVRLPELPSWFSWFGSVGLMVTVILQSREQGRSVWGREGFDALWSAATIKTVGAGVQDPDFCGDLSRLVGDHKVEEASRTHMSAGGGGQTSWSLRTEPILTAADIAALPRTEALLFTSGRRPARVTLHPWYAERDDQKDLIARYSREATEQVQAAAIAYLGPDNPVAAALMAERQATGHG